MSAYCPVSAEIDRHLADVEAAEAAAEELYERFDNLPAETRATLMWDFLDARRNVAGKLVQMGQRVSVVEAELATDFMEWVAERAEVRA